MTEPENIPSLLKLLDDESLLVRREVIQELISFGPILQKEVNRNRIALNSLQEDILAKIFQDQKRLRLKHLFCSWYGYANEYEQLERAMTVFSSFLTEQEQVKPLSEMLDQLAAKYQRKYPVNDARVLAHYLFEEYGLKGDEEDYYNPQNSNLYYVLRKKKGIPISLTTLYMLVGYRLGLSIEGCHFPGHFLARIKLNGKMAFVDCFSSGQIIMENDILRVREEIFEGIDDVLKEKADAQSMVRRYLANLIRAYQLEDNTLDKDLMIELFKELDCFLSHQKMDEITPEKIIQGGKIYFEPGQVVCHKRYGYRGIVVDMDMFCQATDSWYYGNQTQPERSQPWFHVLVHGSDQVTYVAENNLISDDSGELIDHPLLMHFFIEEDGLYIRNENDWPEAEF